MFRQNWNHHKRFLTRFNWRAPVNSESSLFIRVKPCGTPAIVVFSTSTNIVSLILAPLASGSFVVCVDAGNDRVDIGKIYINALSEEAFICFKVQLRLSYLLVVEKEKRKQMSF